MLNGLLVNNLLDELTSVSVEFILKNDWNNLRSIKVKLS